MKLEDAYKKISLQCSRKEYCIFDIEKKMQKWELNLKQQKELISRLLKEHFIDESRYAEAFAKDKFRFNKWGKTKITYHLKQKRISTQNIDFALRCIDEDNYISLINNLLESKNKTIKSQNRYERKTKLLRFMLQKGFEYNLLNEAIEQLLSSELGK